jgi:hypothetical protein
MQALTQPFDSAPRLLARSARVFLGNLPFLAAVTLAVFIPGKLLFQFLGYMLDIPPDGVASYLLMDFSDLVLGSLTGAAAIYGLTAHKGVAASLRRGRQLWARMFWTRIKVEVTIALWTLLLFVPGIVATVKLALTESVVVLEDREPDPLDRSRELTDGRRWSVFFVIAPLMLLDFAGSIGVLSLLPGVAHSRGLLALVDCVLAMVNMWTTVAGLLMYLGIAEPATSTSSTQRQRAPEKR